MKMILLLGLNDVVERYAERVLKIDMHKDIVYYPSVTTHHSEFHRYIYLARMKEPKVITTQNSELIDVFLGSDLNIDIVTVKEYGHEIRARILTKDEAREMRESFDAELRD